MENKMKILQKPISEEFREMTNTCHNDVREVFKHYITEDDVLAYSTNTSIVFLTKKEISELWAVFIQYNKVVDNLEVTLWEDEYQEEFFSFIVKETRLGNSARFFSHMMDEAYSAYMSQGWRLPTIEELGAMYSCTNGKVIKGFTFNRYWASTSHANYSIHAWIVDFKSGCQNFSNKNYSDYVRCVRDGQDDVLELAPTSEEKMTWQEAMDYAKTLQVDPKDVITIKLNGLHYEEVKTEKTYVVRVEVNVKEYDLGEVEVKASSREEAIEKAIAWYQDEDTPSVELWSSDFRETELATETKDSWEVEVKESDE